MILENEFLRVEISDLGAELQSVRDLRNDTELLWYGDPKFWKRRSPVLFPNVGKTWNNEVKINGTVYPTIGHGFARDSRFALESSDAQSAVYLLSSNEETLKSYPFRFELRIVYRLEEKSLKVEWNVHNLSEKDMYFTIGAHPGFLFAHADDRKAQYKLRFPGKNALRYVLLDDSHSVAVADKAYDLALDGEFLPLSEELFARDALIFDGGQIEEAWLCYKDGTPRVGIESKGFPSYGIWSVKDAPYVCLEPWMGRCDDLGYCGELSEKPRVNRAVPNETFKQSYRILLP